MTTDILSRDQYEAPSGSSIRSTLRKSKYFGESFWPSGNIQKNNEWIFTMEVCKLIIETNYEDESSQLIYNSNKYSKSIQEEEELWNWRHSIPIDVFNKEKRLSITKLILSYTMISSGLQVRGKGIQSLILYDNQTSKLGKLNGVGKIFLDLF